MIVRSCCSQFPKFLFLVVGFFCFSARSQSKSNTQTVTESSNIPTDPGNIKIGLDPKTCSKPIVLLGIPASPIDLGVRICAVSELRGVSFVSSSNKIDPAQYVPGWIDVQFVPFQKDCAADANKIQLFISDIKTWKIPKGSLTIWFDSGVADLKGSELGDFQVASVSEGRTENITVCTESKTCSHELKESYLQRFSSGSDDASLIFWPTQIPIIADAEFPSIFNQQGEPLDLKSFALKEKEVVFSSSLFSAVRLDTGEDRHKIPSRFSRAVDHLSCGNAECRLSKQGILLFQIDPSAPVVKVDYSLKPRFIIKTGQKLASSDTVNIKIERCSIKTPKECHCWPEQRTISTS